ncbi:GtrA family protein [Salipiger sp.]|uniref:GtrA family protein n=1 Tax=Salipiger sp. TaxID=2078585 RepID=UPI003A973721
MTDRGKRLLRFGVVGIANTVIYVGGYLLLRTLGLEEIVANCLAFAAAVALQYVAHSRYTFGARVKDPAQFARFLTTIGAGLAVSTMITAHLAGIFGLSDWMAALIVTVVLPVQNYILLSLWVYNDPDTGTHPERI